MKAVDVVIPVYDGLEETRACLESVLATIDPAWARVVIVNDGSPNPAMGPYLRQLAAGNDAVLLLENAKNLGFVATANRGMRHDAERDVLLLNSDVEVAGDWLQRLRAGAYARERVGSITPFSNNATICSFPNLCKDNELLFGLDVVALDRCFAELFGPEEQYEIPTGIGFCMYIRRDCLDAVGYFDEEAFGRGYGEENDWCQRAQSAGWPNFHQANCFVYHKGGVSFAEEQSPRVARAQELLDQKYPRYHADVQALIAADPARAARTRALLTLFAQVDRPKIALISHKLGGGAQQHVDELASLYQDQALFLQITPEVDGQTVVLSLFDGGKRLQDGLYFDVDQSWETMVALLRQLGVGRVHFHHTMGLHPRVWRLGQALDCAYDLTIHDYYLLNGNPTLTDEDARYVGEFDAGFDQRCGGHYPLPDGVSGEQWRENQRLLVEGAARVIFPSADCRRRFEAFFRVDQPVVAWHPDYQLSQPYPAPHWRATGERPLRVLVLGAISREKGADVLEAVAGALAADAVEFHLLGYAYRALDAAVVTHGPYAQAEVYELVEAIAPDVVWYPALWPETYSYTLSTALHLGLPVVVPDIGAFPERVAGRAHSAVLPWDTSAEQWQDFWRGVRQQGCLPGAAAGQASVAEDREFYQRAYLQAVSARAGQAGSGWLQGIEQHLHAGTPSLTRAEKLLERIWRLSRSPLAARVIALVPFRLQRALKRRLSARPMHDIVRGD